MPVLPESSATAKSVEEPEEKAVTTPAPIETVRLANLIVAPVYLLFNIIFFVDATQGWEYYLGVFYVLFNVLIIWHAYRWPEAERA